MSNERVIKCDRDGCTNHFRAGGIPEWLAKQDASRAGWRQFEIVTPHGMRQTDLCPTHPPTLEDFRWGGEGGEL